MNSWPCKDTSKANTRQRMPGSGLHMHHSRAMWPIVTAMAHLRASVDPEDFLHITEYPECRFKEEEEEINTFFGPPVSVSTCEYRCAARARNIRYSILTGRTPFKPSAPSIDPFGPLNKWIWMGDEKCQQTAGNKMYPTVVLRSYLTKLAEILMFRPGSVTVNEKDNLHRIRIQHMETKEIRYAGRVWWAHWLGMTKSKIPFVLDSLFPCSENIFHTTGEFCKEAVGASGPCGAKRYCRQCEQVLGLLGQAWRIC